MFEKITDKARETLYLEPQIHFDCNREMLIENCDRIEEYNEVFMRLISGRLCVQIWGSGLRAIDFQTKGLIIKGKISSIEFIERSGRHHEESTEGLRKDQRNG